MHARTTTNVHDHPHSCSQQIHAQSALSTHPVLHRVRQLPSHSNLFTPYSILAYTLVIRCASAKLSHGAIVSLAHDARIAVGGAHLTTSASVMKSWWSLPMSRHACRMASTIMSTASLQFFALDSSSSD